MKNFIRFLSFILVFSCLINSVFADENVNLQYIDVLDYETANDSGSNYARVPSGGSVFYNMPGGQQFVNFIDVLVEITGNVGSVTAEWFGSRAGLTVSRLGSSQLYRVYGNLGGQDDDQIIFRFGNTETIWIVFKSFRVFGRSVYYYDEIGSMNFGYNNVLAQTDSWTQSSSNSFISAEYQSAFYRVNSSQVAPISLSCANWRKYDYIEFLVSLDSDTGGIQSVSGSGSGGISIPVSIEQIFDPSSVVQDYGTDIPMLEDDHQLYFWVIADVRGLSKIGPSSQAYVYLTLSDGQFTLHRTKGIAETDSINPLFLYFADLKDFLSDALFENFDSLNSSLSEYFSEMNDLISSNHDIYAQWNADLYSLQMNFFRDISSTIEEGFSNIDSRFNDVISNIQNYITDLKSSLILQLQGFQNSMEDLLDKVLHQDTSQSQEFEDDVASQATEFEDISDEIDSVTKPDVDELDPDVSDIVSESDIANFTAILGVLLSNNIFLSVCLMSLTFALVSYTIYGKR